MGSLATDLDKFHITEKYGFLLEEPLEFLPSYFGKWNQLAKEMPILVMKKLLRDAVDKLETLDHRQLSGHRQFRLAHLQLSIIAAGYIWQEGDQGAAKVLPGCISVPWCGVSETLGFQPILCHPSIVLANWRFKQDGRSIESLYQLPGGDAADWFVSVTAQVEMDFAHGVKHVLACMKHADDGDTNGLITSLNGVSQAVHTMIQTCSTMHDNLSAETFYNVLRPFLTGWGGEGTPLPDGIVYEGISQSPRKMTGGSAAQSSTIQAIDAMLGVKHSEEIHSFLENMRHYMPPCHRDFICTIESQSKVKLYVTKQNCDSLTSAYNETVQSVIDFRSYHIQIVTKYIVMQANKATRNKDYETLATRGTGGSSILPFLKTIRSATSESVVEGDH